MAKMRYSCCSASCEVRAKLLQVKNDVILQWVPGHMDIPGNEAADKAAKEAAAITDDPPRPVSLASALSCVNRSIQNMSIEHLRTAQVYRNFNEAKDKAEVKTRKDAVFLAQVRSGHCLSFKAYQHLLNAAVDPTCPRCGEGPHTLEHWFLECAGTESTRLQIFGDVNPSLEVLTDQPGKAVLMSQRTLYGCRVSPPGLCQQQQQQQQLLLHVKRKGLLW